MDDYLDFKKLVGKHDESFTALLERRDRAESLLNNVFREIGKEHTIEHIK
jgi:hypothetical protein